MSILKAFAISFSFAAIVATGQDQVFRFGPPKGTVEVSPEIVKTADLRLSDAEKLIDQTLGSAVRSSKDFYCIIHVLRWKDNAVEVDKEKWFLYHNARWSDLQLAGNRIFGSRNLGLVYLHLNARGASTEDVRNFLEQRQLRHLVDRAIETDVTGLSQELLARKLVEIRVARGELVLTAQQRDELIGTLEKQPADSILERLRPFYETAERKASARDWALRLNNVAEGARLQEVIAPDWGDVNSSNGKSLSRTGGFQIETQYLNVSYRAEVSAKLPHMLKDLADLIFSGQAQATDESVKVQPVSLWGGGVMSVSSVPSDIKVEGSIQTSGAQPVAIGTKTYDNEGKYFWDVSAGIPLKSVKETTFESTSQTLAAREISRQSLYAMLNVLPMKVDTKSKRMGITPVLLVGIGVANRPLDRVIFAGGLGINQIQVFAGTAYTNKQFPGTAPGATVTARRTNLVFGLNIPLRQVLQKLRPE
ncbi:MAG: hypothetical protein SFV51_14275 [Bryobacteraceae bacterium]|nr:hypothetical protein [Bryobacteraceae bacterium]